MINIYLDSSATTKVKQEVVDVMMPYFTEKWYNPSSLYIEATKIKSDIEKARKTVADFIGAKSSEIFFTSCGSEGNCMAIKGFIEYWNSKGISVDIVTTQIEHKSIESCVRDLSSDTFVYYTLIDDKGIVNLQTLEKLLCCKPYNKPTLVSIQFANNEIGTIQPIKEIADLVHKYGAVFHTDAVQAFGKVAINVNELGIDMMTVSGHKIGAPKGIGFLYKESDIEIKPLIYGSQMDLMRGGTENVPYIIGMAKAVECCDTSIKTVSKMCNKRDCFIDLLQQIFGCRLNGDDERRLCNNINVTFPQNITGESLLYTLDLSGIKVSVGSACNSKSIEPSHVLKAIGLTDEQAMKTVRFSLPNDITYEDIDFVIDEIKKAITIIET